MNPGTPVDEQPSVVPDSIGEFTAARFHLTFSTVFDVV